ncbi:hypothetical protein D9611_001213 [Ephemerocybe angulata]|uniref:Uncharacterized protein n=1 Tax=Ephemerocybe angulata TaxID=980116 RepID=A0A8H5FMA2_9AGAR|nr:hypothetical protein D9611_001213 [Tulosesus angulatus]
MANANDELPPLRAAASYYLGAGRKLTYMESRILSLGVWAPASPPAPSFIMLDRPHRRNRPSTFNARLAFLEHSSYAPELGAN